MEDWKWATKEKTRFWRWFTQRVHTLVKNQILYINIDNSTSNERICITFSRKVGNELPKKYVDFNSDPLKECIPWSKIKFYTSSWITQQVMNGFAWNFHGRLEMSDERKDQILAVIHSKSAYLGQKSNFIHQHR